MVASGTDQLSTVGVNGTPAGVNRMYSSAGMTSTRGLPQPVKIALHISVESSLVMFANHIRVVLPLAFILLRRFVSLHKESLHEKPDRRQYGANCFHVRTSIGSSTTGNVANRHSHLCSPKKRLSNRLTF